MRLEHLCDIELNYDEHGLTVLRPFAGREGQGFGAGTGRVEGERLSGDLRWANYPRMREDGVLMPDARGLIDTAEGPVLIRFEGYSHPAAAEHLRAVVSAVTFRAEVEAHRWLNDVIAVHEGWIDFRTMTTRFPTYLCVGEDPG